MEEILREGFAELGIAPPEDAAAKFRGYYERLAETGSVMNLTAIGGEGPVARLHFLDSAALLSLADFSGRRVIDVDVYKRQVYYRAKGGEMCARRRS